MTTVSCGRGDPAQRRDALLVLALGDDDQPGVCGEPGAPGLVQLVPEAGAGAAAGGQEGDQAAAAARPKRPTATRLVPRGEPGDVDGPQSAASVTSMERGGAMPSRTPGKSSSLTTLGRAGRRRRIGGAMLGLLPGAELVQRAQDLGVAAQQAGDQQREQGDGDGFGDDKADHA